MKQLTISTHKHHQLLQDFAARAKDSGWDATHKAGCGGGMLAVCFRYENTDAAFAKGLLTLLTDIVVQENPIYQHSPKMQSMAHDLHKTPIFTSALKSLVRFIRHSRALHLEGYVAFRMAEYREKLDMMSYSLIKKLKFGQID